MKKSLFRTSLVVVLLLALVGLTVSSFAYWDNLTKEDSRTITIGDGVELQFQETLNGAQGNLIPAQAAKKEGDVYAVVYKYNVKLDKKTIEDLNLTVTAENVLIGGVADSNDLVNIDIAPVTSKVNQAGVEVTVTVTLNNVATAEQYNQIKNKAITFTVKFTASK